MKCLACGAEVSASTKFCDYCGSAIVAAAGGAAPQAAVATVSSGKDVGAAPTPSIWPHPEDPIFRLWNAPATHPIRWLAFFFPLAWLAGYGAVRAAIGLAAVFAAADFASRILTLAHVRGAPYLSTALVLFYSYKVAVNAERLVPVRGKFNWGVAIGFMVAYVAIIALLH